MNRNRKEVLRLMAKLDVIIARQKSLMSDADSLKKEIAQLQSQGLQDHPYVVEPEIASPPQAEIIADPVPVQEEIIEQSAAPPVPEDSPQTLKDFHEKYSQTEGASSSKPLESPSHLERPRVSSNLEKFIGENLINKIGIGIIILGVAIGAKYSIDNNLISPLTRILLGYVVGLGLIGFGIKLKPKYEKFSAVLVSGAMAIMYFITYFAYEFYNLIPVPLAFALMVVFTVFTVITALQYSNQIIAQIGLVGAYAVPFLLGSKTGNVHVLFIYMIIINIGILATAFYRDWKPLQYSSFALTWVIFSSWFANSDNELAISLSYSFAFFLTFYASALAYKLIKNEPYQVQDILLILLNAIAFYLVCYATLANYPGGDVYLGLMTLANAIIHFLVTLLILKRDLADKSIKNFTIGLVLVFITIAIPVQLSGTWIPLLWSVEAAVLFWLGRTRSQKVFEILSFPVMIIAFATMQQLWVEPSYIMYSEEPSTVIPFLNVGFLSSAIFVASFGVISYINRHNEFKSNLNIPQGTANFIAFLVPSVLIYGMFSSIRLEIGHLFDNLYLSSVIESSPDEYGYSDKRYNRNIRLLESIWNINYGLIFVSGLALYNLKFVKSRKFGIANMVLLGIGMMAFLSGGLFVLSELRDAYIEGSDYYNIGVTNVLIRYLSILFALLAAWAFYKLTKSEFMRLSVVPVMEIGIAAGTLWLLTSEFINVLTLMGSDNSYKLGLSILWGIFALGVVVIGIWQQKKHLRVAAIALFGVTLAKLFLYDIAHLSTIAKTVVFLILGVLLLIISFLYNKFKQRIEDEVEE